MVSVSDLEYCLHQVADPEVPALSVMDLGIVRSVRLEHGVCQVDLSPTYTGCPATERIERDVREALEALVGVGNVRIRTVLDPPWTTDWLTEKGRNSLEKYGIAPPQPAGGPQRCPLCGSTHLEKVSQFGSTPCKAHWRCKDCLEPFDYFKCI